VFRGSEGYDVRPVTMVDGRSTGVELDQFNDQSQRTQKFAASPAAENGPSNAQLRSLAEIAPSPLAGQMRRCDGPVRVGCWIVIREGGMGVLVIGPPPREMPIASQRCLWPLS